MNSIGSQAGYCTIHGIDKMFVGLEDATEPTCVRCVADATPKLGRVQTAHDPGEEYFKKSKAAKTTVLEPTHGVEEAQVFSAAGTSESYTLENIVGIAVAQLRRLPMPEDIRQFKRVQKVIKTLQSLVETTNG